jgi:hypothetical protein
MKFLLLAVCSAMPLMFTASAISQDKVDHKAHHPESASAVTKSQSAITTPVTVKESIKQMDEQIKMMRDMHNKMANAKTSEERIALMANHMKAMQDGMAMMGNMNKTDADAKNKMKGEMPANMDMHQMMEKRMEMMENMMQMMMDRMPLPTPAVSK